ncbi:MAG TPA: sigma-70 family RNA polymerase sigma factor [Vicinamibacterales bacterium]|nr:sigma-70 family RNA polymerase sigma factor [Vicinamibacterales bacterium]
MYLQVGAEDEDGLIGRCLAGDKAAFEPLVERYYRPLFRAAARLLGDQEQARDATQTAFLKAYQALATCDRQRRFFSWIYRILVNECLNTLRARRPAQGLDDSLAAPRDLADPIDVGETRQRVRKALLQLPPDQRDVIVLRHFAELRYEQIAAVLGVPEKTVKSRLFSARQRLCELLAAKKV